jgi:hypothetical protein
MFLRYAASGSARALGLGHLTTRQTGHVIWCPRGSSANMTLPKWITAHMSRSEELTMQAVPNSASQSGSSTPIVVNCAYGAVPGSWFEQQTKDRLRWIQFNAMDARNSSLLVRHGSLQRLVACFLTAKAAQIAKADVVRARNASRKGVGSDSLLRHCRLYGRRRDARRFVGALSRSSA